VAKYATVPKEVSTTFRAETQAALGAVAGYAAAIAGIPSAKSTTVTTYQQTVFRPTVNPDRRAKGGPVSKGELYRVGEEGEELFVPDRDGTIVNADETERILNGNPRARALAASSGGGGGGVAVAPVQVVFQPSAGGLDNQFFEWLRKGVKNRGGIDVVFR